MKLLALALLLLATTVAADELIDAAKEAKAKRRKSTTKVITNADLKKSKGKVIETKELPPLPADLVPQQGMVEKHEAEKKSQAEAAIRLAATRQKVAMLEEELATLERRYYEENDLDRRDREIVPQFNDVKTRLEAAQRELSALDPPLPAQSPES